MIRGGNRIHNLKTCFDVNKPIITVITVARNCENTIEDTIVNVINQKFINIEYIIIDGGSSDNTLEIIKKYERSIDYWISELDNGIYDAMNKGIDLATGDWINFMNAGDSFYNHNLFSTIFDRFEYNKFDVIYGDFIAKEDINRSEVRVHAKPIKKIFSGMVFSHQSVIIKSKIIKLYPFDLKYKIAADYNQTLLLFTNNYKFLNTKLIFSKMTIDGVSYSNLETIREYISVVKKYNTKRWILFFIPFFQIYFKQLLSAKAISIVRKYKWKVERFFNIKS